MAIETTEWDITEYLGDDTAVAEHLEAVMEDGDPSLLSAALGDIARAKGMTQIAKDAGVSREALYKSLKADGNPKLSTFMGVLSALNIRLSVVPRKPDSHA